MSKEDNASKKISNSINEIEKDQSLIQKLKNKFKNRTKKINLIKNVNKETNTKSNLLTYSEFENYKECIFCDEKKRILVNDVCVECYIQNIKTNTLIDNNKFSNGTMIMIVFSSLEIHKLRYKNHRERREIINLQRLILDKVRSNLSFDRIIETKCSCGKIISRNDDYGEKPHELICTNCPKSKSFDGLNRFCSNCGNDVHNTKKFNVTCEQYQEILNVFTSDFSKKWRNAMIEDSKLIKIMKDNNNAFKSTQKKLDSEDIRICPYSFFETAKRYEEHQLSKSRINVKDMLTRKYSKDEWDSIGCPSKGYPVCKVNCNDVTCGEHNKEHVKFNDGKSLKGCKRRINWGHWPKFKPKKEIITNVNFSKLIKVTNVSLLEFSASYSIFASKGKNTFVPNKCGFCKNYTMKMSVTCLNSYCPYKYTPICGSCLVKKITLAKSDNFASVNFQGTSSITLKRNTSGKFAGIARINCEYNIYEMEYSEFHKSWILQKKFMATKSSNLPFLKIPPSRSKIQNVNEFIERRIWEIENNIQIPNKNDIAIMSGLGNKILTNGTYDVSIIHNKTKEIDTGKCTIKLENEPKYYNKLRHFNCIENSHILKYNGLEFIKKKLVNITELKEKFQYSNTENNSINDEYNSDSTYSSNISDYSDNDSAW